MVAVVVVAVTPMRIVMRAVLVVAPCVATSRLWVVVVLNVVYRHIAHRWCRRVDVVAMGVRGLLRYLLADDGADDTTDAAADDGTIAAAHRIADHGAGNGTDTAADGSAEHIGAHSGRREQHEHCERNQF